MERVKVEWRGEGSVVQISGDFNQWEVRDMVKEGEGVWQLDLILAPGTYKYKFVVDGEDNIDSEAPTETDSDGNMLNVLEVEGVSDGEMSNDSDSWEIVNKVKDEAHAATVIERLYTLGEGTVERLKEMGGEVVQNVNYTDLYYDTEDYLLLRKGTWLRKRVEEESWQIRYLDEGGKMVVSEDKEDVGSRLGEELGEAGSVEEMVKERLGEVSRMEGKVLRYMLGEVELELVQEEGVATVCVRLVGDVLASLADLDKWADKLQLKSFDMTEHANKIRQ